MKTTTVKPTTKRPRETRYFGNASYRNPRLAVSKGFPKSEDGSIEGAARAVARGYARKVQCIDRIEHPGKVLWTVKALPRIPGVSIVPYEVIRGDDADRPTIRRGRRP